jgi:hypothetical protein
MNGRVEVGSARVFLLNDELTRYPNPRLMKSDKPLVLRFRELGQKGVQNDELTRYPNPRLMKSDIPHYIRVGVFAFGPKSRL